LDSKTKSEGKNLLIARNIDYFFKSERALKWSSFAMRANVLDGFFKRIVSKPIG
jgi:hypothetical protein